MWRRRKKNNKIQKIKKIPNNYNNQGNGNPRNKLPNLYNQMENNNPNKKNYKQPRSNRKNQQSNHNIFNNSNICNLTNRLLQGNIYRKIQQQKILLFHTSILIIHSNSSLKILYNKHNIRLRISRNFFLNLNYILPKQNWKSKFHHNHNV